MSRFIQQGNMPAKKEKKEKPRTMAKAGSYSVKDLQAKGVKSGVWEKKDA